jgi:hypothetical protein
LLRSSGVQEFRSSGVQEFRSSGVQEFRSSGVQEFRSSGVQELLWTTLSKVKPQDSPSPVGKRDEANENELKVRDTWSVFCKS